MFLDDNGRPERSKSVFISVTVTFILASIFVIARLVSRFGIVKYRGRDDYFIILAWVSLLAWVLQYSVGYVCAQMRLMRGPDPSFCHVLHDRL
jgi:cation transporter-like permease